MGIICARLALAMTVLGIFYGWPWLFWYHSQTGLWVPPALPSRAMLLRAPFVAAASARATLFYFTALIQLAPIYALPLAAGAVAAACALWEFVQEHRIVPARRIAQRTLLHGRRYMVPFDAITTKNIVLVIWAGGFVVGMSALGALGGAGFQMRFVLPATPALSVLSAKTIIGFQRRGPGRSSSSVLVLCAVTALSAGAMHCLYNGILFAPLRADIGGAGWATAFAEGASPLSYPPTSKSRPLVAHYGAVF